MKKAIYFLCVACITSAFISCSSNSNIDQELAQVQKQQVEKEYNALPELSPLTLTNLADSTNFALTGDKKTITYSGQSIPDTNGMTPLYGSGDVMLLSSGKMFAILYKNELTIDPMAYKNYSIVGAKASGSTLYVKGDLNGKTIFVKYVSETGKMFHEYTYGY
jgi:hypothetical protein